MNKRFEEEFWQDGIICDCCGMIGNGQELHTLEGNCPITLCRECILKFFCMIERKKKEVIFELKDIQPHDQQ